MDTILNGVKTRDSIWKDNTTGQIEQQKFVAGTLNHIIKHLTSEDNIGNGSAILWVYGNLIFRFEIYVNVYCHLSKFYNSFLVITETSRKISFTFFQNFP